jgi:23S rRNA U2552 (ribose-2'-O)-methylase RlmE/FtsJ
MLDEALGNNPYEHLNFLKETRERSLSLKSILNGIIKPGMSVLDLGTGALGNLAIMAAKMGATRVVAVDCGNVNIAREIAEENNVIVEFIQQDFKDLDLNGETFDVILGTIYYHEPWFNDGQQINFKKCIEKFGHQNTLVIPDHVEYTGTGCGFGAINTQGLYDDISLVEEGNGITLNYLRNKNNFYYKKFLMSSNKHEALTELVRLARVDYTSDYALEERPMTLQLKVISDGWLTAIRWDMATMYKDKLIRRFGHLSPITNPRNVVEGEVITISIPQHTNVWFMGNGKVSICG